MGKIIVKTRVKSSIATIVAGIDHYNALGMIRSLGETGIPVYFIVKTEGDTFVEHSKYITESFKITELTEIDNIIRQISTIYSNTIVFPVTDEMAIFFDSKMNGIYSNVIFPGANGKLYQFMDKSFSKKKAMDAGLLVPRGAIISMKNEKQEWMEFPCILKPEQSIEGRKCDIEIAYNNTELEKIISKYMELQYKNALVETYITGNEEYMIEIMGERSDKGITLGPIIKKIREYPIKNGSTAYAELVEHIPGLDMNLIKKYIDSTGYVGLFDVELKYADGSVYFIECNFRNGAPNNVLTKYGMNIPVLWINEMLNADIEIKHHRKFKKVIVEQTDILNAIKGAINPFIWIGQFCSAKKVFWDMKDMQPCLYYYASMINLGILRLRGKR